MEGAESGLRTGSADLHLVQNTLHYPCPTGLFAGPYTQQAQWILNMLLPLPEMRSHQIVHHEYKHGQEGRWAKACSGCVGKFLCPF